MSMKVKYFHPVKTWLNGKIIQSWLDRGLRAKLGLMVTVGVIGLIFVFALLGINTARQSTESALNERVFLARVSADKLDFVFDSLIDTLSAAANRSSVQNFTSSQSEMEEILQGISAFDQPVILIDASNAATIASTKRIDTIDWNTVPSYKYAAQAVDSGNFISILPGEKPKVLLAVPVIKPGGTSKAVLAVLLDLSDPEVSPYSGAFELGNTGTLEVVNSKGLILMSTQAERVMTIYEYEPILNNLFLEDSPGVETCLGCTDEMLEGNSDEVIAFARLNHIEWGVIVRQKAAEVFAPVRTLMIQTVGLGLFTVAGSLFLVWLTTNSVITPVQALTTAVHRIIDGDLTTPVNPWGHPFIIQGKRRDEIGQLADSFDEMRLRLKNLIGEIRQLNQDLDQRVHERTQAAIASQLEAQAARDDLRGIIDALDDSLVVIGIENHQILQMNRAAQEFCNQPNELIGEKCYQILPSDQPCGYPHAECPIGGVLSTRESVKITQPRYCSYSGETRYFDVVASPLFDANGKITRIVELSRDVTEERQMREDLLRRNQQLAILNSVSNTVNQSLDIEELLRKALEEILRLTSIDAGAVFLKEDLNKDLKLMAHQGLSEEAANLAAQVGLLDGSCGGVLETGQITIVPDVSRFRGHRARSLQRERLITLVHIPLVAKGSTLGSMCVGTKMQCQFNQEEQQLFQALGSQIAVAIENAQLYAEVQNKEQLRGELFVKAINAQEEERKRIARELHDETSQSLTALLYFIEEALEMKTLKDAKGKLLSMLQLTKHVLDNVHKIIFDLRPSMLDHLGLVPALRWFAESRLEPKGVRVVVEELTPSKRLPSEVETAIFRIVQEAVTNITRHAAARNVHITFNMTGEQVIVCVEDDGIGFNIESLEYLPDSTRGLGLLSMQERLELLGGELEISTLPGQGTQVMIRLGL